MPYRLQSIWYSVLKNFFNSNERIKWERICNIFKVVEDW